MTLLTIVGIALGLAMDAFAAAVGASIRLRHVSPRQVFRFGWHFGLFQAIMPVIGWYFGTYLEELIVAWDHWVAFALLSYVGGKGIHEALSAEAGDARTPPMDPTRGWSLVMLSVATSIDALAVGISFGIIAVNIWYPAAIIGIITAVLTTLGMLFGARLGLRFGKRVEALGGAILIVIGIKILLEHMVTG
ncbi:MAG TPA: manganese efflux pump MntP family protein [Candidatus Hydrogenedentes bacterium]|nr:manganese efflux pump MntP family protein [Candidatus Hydrogenedentota bacterium]HQH53923.1 manganese efflux pump MntP family protein [Candidatus Hydrogenedentota bacterium]